jgi:hypothetical protein
MPNYTKANGQHNNQGDQAGEKNFNKILIFQRFFKKSR